MPGRITRLQATGFMGLEEIDLPLAPITTIHGPNERGKTRLLEALRMCILGKCGADAPVTLGAEGADLRVEGDYADGKLKILRTLTADGKTDKLLVWTGPEGKMVREKGRVQEFLNGLIRPFQVDVMAFYQQKPADQRALLLSTVTDVQYDPLERVEGVDYSAHPLEVIAAEVDVLFRRRTKLNTDAGDKLSAAAGMEADIPAGFDPEAVRGLSSLEMSERLRVARNHNDKRREAEGALIESQREIDRLVAQIKDLQARLGEGQQVLGIQHQWLADNPELDTTDLEADMGALDAQRATLQIHDAAHAARAAAAEMGKQASALTEQITTLRARPAALLAQGTTAIEGLGVDGEGNLTVNDLPLSNLSGEQRINLAVQVAMATQGEIPLMLVDNLDAMDSEHRALLEERARQSGMQWVMARTTDGEFEVVYLEGDDRPPAVGFVCRDVEEGYDAGVAAMQAEERGEPAPEVPGGCEVFAGVLDGTLTRLRPYEGETG